jgi:chromosome segregation ATPase
VDASNRLEELLDLKEALQTQLDAANRAMKEQEGQLKAAREAGEVLTGQLSAAEEAAAAADKVRRRAAAAARCCCCARRVVCFVCVESCAVCVCVC